MNIPTFIGEIPIFTYMEVMIRGCHPKRKKQFSQDSGLDGSQPPRPFLVL